MYIIAGLGNPSREYENTRHNIGFETVDALAEKFNIKLNIAKYKSLCGSGIINGQKVLLLKPQTFMNLSGEAIRPAMDFFKIDPETELLVICDDIYLSAGQLRIREKGSAGGHNGLKNIISHIGTEKFTRIKMGVGEKPKDWDLKDWVLGHFVGEDRKAMDEAVKDAVSAVELIVNMDIGKAMNLYNKKKQDGK